VPASGAARLVSLQVSIRASIAAAGSVAVAGWLDLEFPLYAMISAVIVTDLSPVQTRRLSLPRFAGTVIGAAVGAACSPLLSGGITALAAGIFGAMALTHLLALPDAAKVAGYVCGIILIDQAAAPWSYAAYRLAETALGIGVAVLVSHVPKLLRAEPECDMRRPA
jgi:uncharacterized membrane protein YgaE (UPF0421/DUF939 family)